MISYVTTREEIADVVGANGELSFAKMLLDLGFDPERPTKVDYKGGKIEFWQPENDLLIAPSNPVVNGGARGDWGNAMRQGRARVMAR